MKKKALLICVLETLIVNSIVAYIFFYIQPNQDVYLSLNPHPCFLLSLAMGWSYGNFPGLISGIISCFFYAIIFNDLNKNFLDIFIYFKYYKYILMFLVGAIVSGYLKDKYNFRVNKLKGDVKLLQGNYKKLHESHQLLDKAQQELKKQIINSEESILHLYEIASRLETLDSEQVYTETIGILSKYLKADAVAIYTFMEDSGYIRLKVRIGQSKFDSRSINIRNSYGYSKVIFEKQAIKWSEVQEDSFPLMSAPLIKDNQVLAVVNIEHMEFDKLSEYAFQLFKLVIDWVNRALEQAIYVDGLKESKYIEGTRLLKYEYFVERLQEEERRRIEFGMEYGLLKYKMKEQNEHSIQEKVIKHLRTVDVASFDPQEATLYILLPATPKENLHIVEQRILGQLEALSIALAEDLNKVEDISLLPAGTKQEQALEEEVQLAESFDHNSKEIESSEIWAEDLECQRDVVEVTNSEVAIAQSEIPEDITENQPPSKQIPQSDESEYPDGNLKAKDQLVELVTPQSLMAKGLRLVKEKQYPQAVRLFLKVTTFEQEVELRYLAVSELSSLYLQVGQYSMAQEIIITFSANPDLKDHPGMPHLKRKMLFIKCLNNLLKQYQYGNIPYEQVPEQIIKEAYMVTFMKTDKR